MRQRGLLVIGVDGMRWDARPSARTPHLDAIARAGMFTSFPADDRALLASGPLWASVATGVWPNFHGVHDDDLSSHRLASFPDFLHALTRADARIRTYVAAGRPAIARRIFRPAHQTVVLRGEVIGYAKADESVTQNALRAIEDSTFDAAFLHLAEPRSVAIRHGIGAEYTAAVARADERIGRIATPWLTRPDADWTIVVVTDHCRFDPGASGGRSATGWVAARGPGIESRQASHVDIFPTAFAALGLVPHRGYGLVGAALQKCPMR